MYDQVCIRLETPAWADPKERDLQKGFVAVNKREL
jgi:hypothetical protein